MLEGPYSDAEIDAAVEALGAPDRLAGAQDTVARFAPQIQRVLNEALAAGGWFGSAHESEVERAALTPDELERLQAVRTLVAEETRLAMLVGAAVGLGLGEELRKQRGD